MLLFALWLISTSKGGGLNYGDLVDNVKDTFDDCLAIVADVGGYVGEVDSLGNVRRRDGDHAVQLGACVSMLKAMDKYRFTHSKLLLAQSFVSLEEKAYLNQLLMPVSKRIGNIPLYLASKDGDSAQDFHAKCDGKGPTVVIIRTTTGNVFGGYAHVSWRSDNVWTHGATSFLFRLRPSFGEYAKKTGNNHYAVYGGSSYGPTFGNGHDIYVQSGALTGTGSHVAGAAYAATGNTLNNGTTHFRVEDYVVFQAVSL